VPKAQAPQVVDRSSSRRLEVRVAGGTGTEAVLALLVLNSGPPFDRFERGDEIARIVRRQLPDAVDRAISRLKTPAGDPWSGLLGLVAVDEPPHDVATVIDRLARSDPETVKLAMMGLHRPADEVQPVAAIEASELVRLVVEAMRAMPDELYLGGAAAVLLDKNAVDAQRLLAEADGAGPVIERLTNGLVYKPEPGIAGVLLIPSLVHRPWTLLLDHDRMKVICYPARLESELSAPDVSLISIYRALGDGTRLRILRHLAAGTATVGRIGEELSLAKSTVYEHLMSLRSAGLVRLATSGGFELEPELPDLNWMLKEFLGLEMRRECEGCGQALEADGVAYICSYECTFCADCAGGHNHVCPNCAGELVLRPRRTNVRSGRIPRTRSHADERLFPAGGEGGAKRRMGRTNEVHA
jgi:hypothetical protein